MKELTEIQKKYRGLSDFIRNASEKEWQVVFSDVMAEVDNEQQKVLDKAAALKK